MGFTADISVGDCRLFWGDEPERQSSISSCFCSVTSYYLKDYPCTPVFIFIFCFLGLHLQHMKVPRLGVQSEIQQPAYTTATAMQDLSCLCYQHHNSWQCQILNPLSETRDQTHILMDTIWACYQWTMMGTPLNNFKKSEIKHLFQPYKHYSLYYNFNEILPHTF